MKPFVILTIPIFMPFLTIDVLFGSTKNVNCTIEGLTKSCAILDDEKANGLTEFPDGSFYVNPRELEAVESFSDPKKPEALARKKEILEQWHSYIYDYDLKKWNTGFIDSILDEKFLFQMGENPAPKSISVCWPPDKSEKSCSIREIPTSMLQKILKSKPDPQHRFDFETVGFYHGRSLQNIGASQEAVLTKIIEKQQSARQSKKQLVDQISEKVRKNLIATIKADRLDSNLSDSEKILIKKIETISINHGDNPDVSIHQACQGLSPNAFYEPTTHSINLCDNMYGMSEANLALTLAHEMSHAIDPCNFRNTLWIKKTDQTVRFANTPMRMSELFQPFTTMTPINEEDSLESYPFKAVYQCLQENYNLEATNTTSEERNTETLNRQDRLIKKVGRMSNVEVSPMVIGFSRHNAKNDCTNFSNMNEALADWLAGETVGSMIQKGDIKSTSITSSPLLPTLMGCWQKEDATKENNQQAVLLALDAHPIARDREDILMQNPTIRKTLRCLSNPKQSAQRCLWKDKSQSASESNQTPMAPEEHIR
jgi:hypothetical protein